MPFNSKMQKGSVPNSQNNSGTYQLVIHLEADRIITVGKLGRFHFPAGYYIYSGSAQKNLTHRISRHLRKKKPLRWHIDYLLSCPSARII